MNNNDSIYQEVTDRIIAKLEAGTIPWQQPWSSSSTGFSNGAPRNIVSKKAYRGINSIMLGIAGFTSPWWMTFNQARELGGHIIAGSKSSMVVFFKRIEKTDKKGKPILNAKGEQEFIPMLRYSRVFNIEQTEGITAPDAGTPVIEGDAAEEDSSLDKAKAIVKNANLCPIKNGGSQACYLPNLDIIKMPKVKDFHNPASYYHTLFHELVHATGHPSRLNRKGEGVTVNAFKSEEYSKEELVAEIGASFVSNVAGILCDVQFENSAAYIKNWLSVLKDDHKFVVKAAAAAQRAADMILHVENDNN